MGEIMSEGNGNDQSSTGESTGPKYKALTVVVVGLGQMGRKCHCLIDVTATASVEAMMRSLVG